jgi:hypothetical protein
MIGSYLQYYGQGAGRMPMPVPIIFDRGSVLNDILIICNLIKTGKFKEAFRAIYSFSVNRILPNLVMIFLAGTLLCFMILVSMKVHLLNGEKLKAEPIVIQPEIITVKKKEIKVVQKKPKIIEKKIIDIPKKAPPPKKDVIKPEKKRVLLVRKRETFEKKIKPEFTKPIRRKAENNALFKKEIVNIPIRSDGFNPVKRIEPQANVQRATRQDIGLYTPKNYDTVSIKNSHIKSKREGLAYSPGNVETANRADFKYGGFSQDSQGSSEMGLSITGISLESLEACPNPLDEIECKKKILKIIGEQQQCNDSTGEYVFFKTKTITSFGMLVKPTGGRKLLNRCGELDNAYNCLNK